MVEKLGVYLEASLHFVYKKGEVFQSILDRFKVKLQAWRRALLSLAGRCILAKHSLLPIPIYLLSVFRAPHYFVQQI